MNLEEKELLELWKRGVYPAMGAMASGLLSLTAMIFQIAAVILLFALPDGFVPGAILLIGMLCGSLNIFGILDLLPKI